MKFRIKELTFVFITTFTLPIMANGNELLNTLPDNITATTLKTEQSPLVGAWMMVKFEVDNATQLTEIPYNGQLIITNSGTLSAQSMNPDKNAPDTAYTVNGYEALYGDISIDDHSNRFILIVRSSLAKDLIGREMERSFDITGDTLVLSPIDKNEGWRVTYERY